MWRSLSSFFLLLTLVSAGSVNCPNADPWYESWMGYIAPAISNLTVLDLTFPGTHDTVTFNLSLTVADDTNDLPAADAKILHDLSPFLDLIGAGNMLRDHGVTQGLTLTEQLNAGIRFIDFRVTFTAPPNASSTAPYDWYGVHLLQTERRSIEFLTDLRAWLEEHPSEIVVVWVSLHGNPCQTIYTGATNEQMQAFWSQVEKLFADVLFDNRVDGLNTTTYEELMQRNHRAVFFVSEYVNMTNSSPFAHPGCNIDNQLSLNRMQPTREQIDSQVRAIPARRAGDRATSHFHLASLAGSEHASAYLYDALLRYLPSSLTKDLPAKCAKLYHFTGMDDWCPQHLQEMSQLANYYAQVIIDDAVTLPDAGLPNAIYLDAVDCNGTIRTGYSLYGEAQSKLAPTSGDGVHLTTGFGYVDAFAYFNVMMGCKGSSSPKCAGLIDELSQRRQLSPVQLWDDAKHGRLLKF